MNTYATWTIILAGPATESLKRIPTRDRERIHAALKEMEVDPFQGDIKYLKGQSERLRRRVGNWRIFFRLVVEQRHVVVLAIERRTSTTY